MSTTAQTGRAQLVRAIADAHRDQRGALMPILHEVMAELGCVEREDVEVLADALNISVADVHGVVSFYKDFRTEPSATHVIALCRAEACQALGSQALYESTTARAGELGEDVEVEEIFCFGNCALGPSGMIDGRLHGRLSDQRIGEITKGWQR